MKKKDILAFRGISKTRMQLANISMQRFVEELQSRARQAGKDIVDAMLYDVRGARELGRSVEAAAGAMESKVRKGEKIMAKPKFKIGDKVKILDGSNIEDYVYGWGGINYLWVNTTQTIWQIKVFRDGRVGYVMREANRDIFDERGLELVESVDEKKNETIVIYRNGNEVIAFDKRNGKKGIARCNPKDTFYFDYGADLAFFRLMQQREFKVGDTVIGLPSANVYTVTKEGYIGTVDAVLGDSFRIKGADGFSPWVSARHFCVLSPKEVKKDVIEVGDKVKIKDATLLRPGYVSWAERNVKHPRLLARFDPKGNIGFSDLERAFYVLAIGEGKALISIDTGAAPCYVIDIKGLVKA